VIEQTPENFGSLPNKRR